jgi:cobalt-zinc-cadmium efflux system membrane fusion protein
MGGPLALTAAIDGVVLEQGVQLGQRVEASALIYRIARLSPLWLEIQAPVDLAPTAEGTAIKLAGSEVSGKLIAIGRAVDAASQTVLLRAEVDKGAETLRPGQVVEVEIAGPAGRAATPARRRAGPQSGPNLPSCKPASDERASASLPARCASSARVATAWVDGIKAGERVAVKGVSGLKAMLTGVGKE